VVVVPAHNEEAILAGRLGLLNDATAGQATVLLVADNCTDSTAEIGRRLGVEVIERSDKQRRGKGFALDFARQSLEPDPPDVVVIIDADCMTDRHSVGALIEACAATERPCQATNLQRPDSGASPSVQLSTFAFFIKNVIRQRALQRIVGRAHLLGTGMALPWHLFAGARLATSNIVEDLKLGQDLAAAGHEPLFIEQANVWSAAESERNTLSQRQRWEGGFLQNALRAGPRALARSIARGDARGLWAAIDMMIPPFALLILIDVAMLLAVAAGGFLAGAETWPLFSLAAAVSATIGGLALAWLAGGRRFVTLGALMRAPLYVAWKVPMYAGFARRGAPKDWHRTDRE
jgi:hypothetical protein